MPIPRAPSIQIIAARGLKPYGMQNIQMPGPSSVVPFWVCVVFWEINLVQNFFGPCPAT